MLHWLVLCVCVEGVFSIERANGKILANVVEAKSNRHEISARRFVDGGDDRLTDTMPDWSAGRIRAAAAAVAASADCSSFGDGLPDWLPAIHLDSESSCREQIRKPNLWMCRWARQERLRHRWQCWSSTFPSDPVVRRLFVDKVPFFAAAVALGAQQMALPSKPHVSSDKSVPVDTIPVWNDPHSAKNS